MLLILKQCNTTVYVFLGNPSLLNIDIHLTIYVRRICNERNYNSSSRTIICPDTQQLLNYLTVLWQSSPIAAGTGAVDINFSCVAASWMSLRMFHDIYPFSWLLHQMETFSALLALCRGTHRSPVNSPHKRQWHGALMLPFICNWINVWAKNREAGELRRHHAHYDVTTMSHPYCSILLNATFFHEGINYPSR